MQWTPELDALLNQCVFESGYDFTAAVALLLNRARQLRLVSGDNRIVLSSDECQVHWMEINPVVEEDNEDGHAEGDEYFRRSFHDDDFHFYRHHSDPSPEEGHEPVLEMVEHTDNIGGNELRPVEHTIEETSESTLVDVPEGCPRLELSLSDADLDALLNSLPYAHEDVAAADPKTHETPSGQSSSEMQWVLSFLSNPDEAAHHDAEAKNMLFDCGDRSEDDNFQYFLQQLNRANLMSPEKPIASTVLPSGEVKRENLDTTSEGSDDSDDDWMESRKQIKTGTVRTNASRSKAGTAPSHKRRLEPRASHADEVLPPAAPLRFALLVDDTDHQAELNDCVSDDSDDNGLDALPKYEPSASTRRPLRMPAQHTASSKTPNSSKLLALSEEIGQQMRKHGEFQFPKRLFRDFDNTTSVEVEQEQVPEDEP